MLSRDDFFAELSRQTEHLVAGKKMGLILARVQRLGEINIIMDKELVDAAQARIGLQKLAPAISLFILPT